MTRLGYLEFKNGEGESKSKVPTTFPSNGEAFLDDLECI
jgi:hypothetical protein